MSFKSRNKPFALGEFERWIIGGMKHACTIEDYSAFGNNPIVVDFPDGRINRWRTQPINSSEQLLSIISGFKDGQEFDISFSNREVIHPTARRKQERLNPLGKKPSVLERIAESRAQAAAEEKPKQGKHSKSRDAEL